MTTSITTYKAAFRKDLR